jgi:elongation factor Tu
MDNVDSYIPTPARETENHSYGDWRCILITGRGTVATGRIERGQVNVGDTVELVGMAETKLLLLLD